MKSAIFHSLKKDIDAPFICICDSYEKHMMDIDWQNQPVDTENIAQ
jgi:hypothetical protein